MNVREWLPRHLADYDRPHSGDVPAHYIGHYQAWIEATPQEGRCQHVVLSQPVRNTYLRGVKGVWCGNRLPCGYHDNYRSPRKVQNRVDHLKARRLERQPGIMVGGVPLGLLLELRTSRHAEHIMATLDAITEP